MTPLEQFIHQARQLFVLTGAGCSTAAGIPDYRDEGGQWKRAQPMTYQHFTASSAARRRYWARSLVGWPIVDSAVPGTSHRALARLQTDGPVHYLLTQNVDGLHRKAGSPQVQELHGRLDTIICLQCGERTQRRLFQQRMAGLNPAWADRRALVAPDGDADIDETDFSDFIIPDCERCAGVLKPDVVYFGEAVPRDRVQEAMLALERADAMLIVGSSMMVFSGFRFARRAHELGLPIASLTLGKGRADPYLTLKVDAPCEDGLRFALGEPA